MKSSICEKDRPLREWAPLTKLLHNIPAKIQFSLFTQNINLTCIDGITEYIAIGTNQGLIYWFNRNTEELSTLSCEGTNNIITCVKVLSTVDYMVAAGSSQGIVTIFQIPKEMTSSLHDSLKIRKKKQIERFKINDLHKVTVTALEWSKNGMKLFSGDRNGLVVITEMDFNLHLSKSTEFLNEKYPVVQLSYQYGLLLISTVFRTILVNGNQNNQVIQVGQKERKMLGKYGAVFSKTRNHIEQPIIYASRPGYRIWQADKTGTVIKTLILKEAIKLAQNRVELLNPIDDSFKKKRLSDSGFGIIKPFYDDLLITYNEDIIYIINSNTCTIKSVVTELRKVTDITCIEDEIFILEGERGIIRIASYPEKNNYNSVFNELEEQPSSIDDLNKPITWGFAELTSKLKSGPIIPAISFQDINASSLIQSPGFLQSVVAGIDLRSVVHAEEASESLSNIPVLLDTNLSVGIDTVNNEISNDTVDKVIDRKYIFQKISEQDFEEILFTSPSKSNHFSQKLGNNRLSKNKSKNTSIQILNTEIVKKNNLLKHKHSTSLRCNSDSYINLNIERNIENIQKSVHDKEKLLSSYLDLDLSKYYDKNDIYKRPNSYCSAHSGYTNQFINILYSKQSEEEPIIDSANQRLPLSKSREKITATLDLAEVNKEISKVNSVHEPSENIQSNIDNKNIMETKFNELSKEFVKTNLFQDDDDWIILG